MDEPGSERRAHPRAPVSVGVRVGFTGSEFLVRTANLSAGGLLLETDQRLPVGTRVSLRIEVPILTKYPIRAEGEVVRLGAQPACLAVRFTDISEADRDLLGELADGFERLLGEG
jgi:hypothetical protein